MSASGADDREALDEALLDALHGGNEVYRYECARAADAVLTSGWLARVKREAAAEAEVRVLRETADRLDDFVFPAGSDALEPMFRLVTELRRKAHRVEVDTFANTCAHREGATDADH